MENIQNQMKELFGGSCYAYCIAWLFDGARTTKDLTSTVLKGWYNGFIDNDGFVSKPVRYINEICEKQAPKVKDVVIVEKISKSDIPTVPTIVEMACPSGGSHFVVCHRNGTEVILDFDPSYLSNSWVVQEFISYRRYI
jgi:hypothetical protein